LTRTPADHKQARVADRTTTSPLIYKDPRAVKIYLRHVIRGAHFAVANKVTVYKAIVFCVHLQLNVLMRRIILYLPRPYSVTI